MELPGIGSIVSVTTKTRNTYYFTYKEQPFDYKTYNGRVVKNEKWLQANYLSVETGDANYPIAMIAHSNIDSIKVISSVGGNKYQQFPVVGSKGQKYTVSKTGEHYSCDCTGFKYYNKCKHINLVRNDKYE